MRVAQLLGGVEGMLILVKDQQPRVVLQGLQALRYLLYKVPLRALLEPSEAPGTPRSDHLCGPGETTAGHVDTFVANGANHGANSSTTIINNNNNTTIIHMG
ncbi:unnamed protein product, partial [Sphacelaria rigidula]